ncbi:riboflavin synthase [Paenibacillus glacialis]|uniref:Riboflavin synthase n=1 Tax=Paenibacillus glacialis TaxID=494026 RepID=A0A168M4Z9_9BACL|nr:riboflavin synthase [Paenibacillus glacialis]OAB44228.1 riboflavin synthase subunit alpha [Paenibacillus glacialis]
MFTGLVEEIGTLRGITRNGEAMVLHITASTIMSDLKIGDSVAINGVCLTATSLDSHSFAADVMPETFRKSNLKDLQTGSKVNLERAMIANGRFGGHIVQGHVDGIGRIQHVTRNQNAVVYEIKPISQNIFKYIIPKGSITLDGISLTVVQVKESTFEVSVIPHTLEQTVLNHKRAGDTVNIECDVLGKYVEHLLQYGSTKQQDSGKPSGIDMEYLARNGFA